MLQMSPSPPLPIPTPFPLWSVQKIILIYGIQYNPQQILSKNLNFDETSTFNFLNEKIQKEKKKKSTHKINKKHIQVTTTVLFISYPER